MNTHSVREPTEFPDSHEEEKTGFFVVVEWAQLRDVPNTPHSIYGVGINCPFRDELPEWAQTAIALLDIGSQTPTETVPGIGYKGSKYYEFIGPKYEN